MVLSKGAVPDRRTGSHSYDRDGTTVMMLMDIFGDTPSIKLSLLSQMSESR